MSQHPPESGPGQGTFGFLLDSTKNSRARDVAAPDVSVCIVNWNCRDLLRGCLQSLLQEHQGVRLEVIVVDNASTDGAPEMVAREFSQVCLVRNDTNAGFSRANNQAARQARGSFLFFLNNDTVVPPYTLLRLVDFLRAHPRAILAGPRLRDGQGKIQTSFRQRPTVATFLHRTLLLRWTGLFRGNYKAYRREEVTTQDLNTGKPVEVLMGAALMGRRQDLLKLGGWDEDFTFGGEDLELCYRANRQGQVMYLPDIEITHFGRVSTRQNIDFASTQIAAGFVQYFRKSGASRPAIWGYKVALTLDAPLQILVKGSQFLWRKLLGRSKQAEQSRTVVRGAWSFLTRGLGTFWRA